MEGSIRQKKASAFSLTRYRARAACRVASPNLIESLMICKAQHSSFRALGSFEAAFASPTLGAPSRDSWRARKTLGVPEPRTLTPKMGRKGGRKTTKGEQGREGKAREKER